MVSSEGIAITGDVRSSDPVNNAIYKGFLINKYGSCQPDMLVNVKPDKSYKSAGWFRPSSSLI